MNKKLYIYILIIISIVLIFVFPFKKPSKPEKTDVVFWTLQMGTFSKYINGVIDEFEKENPNIHIVWVDVPYSEGEKRTLAAILSNNPPDLVNLTPDFSILLAQRKALYTLSPSMMVTYEKSISDTLKCNSGYYAFPFYATSALTLYNSELFRKTNLKEVPKTYDQMYSKAEQIKKLTGVFVTMPTLTENDTILKILNKYNINSPESIKSEKSLKIFEQYKYLYKNNLIPKESITQSHMEALEKFMAGQIVFLPAGANFLNIIKENSPEIFKKTEVSTQLTGDTGKYDFSLMNLVVTKKSKNPEAAIKFALFLTNKENQLELAKLTSILPVNKDALNDKYFTDIKSNDIFSKARAISSSQLKNTQKPIPQSSNQKELLTLTNNFVQEIVLEKGKTQDLLNDFSNQWDKLKK